MTLQCVVIDVLPDGREFIRPIAESPCSTGLYLMDSGTLGVVHSSPLLIPMDQAPGLMLALLGLFVAAWTAKAARRAID